MCCCHSLIRLLTTKMQPGRYLTALIVIYLIQPLTIETLRTAALFPAAETNINSLGLGEAYCYQQPMSRVVEGARLHNPAEFFYPL